MANKPSRTCRTPDTSRVDASQVVWFVIGQSDN
ncbi:hypothetical protein DDE82_000382 [Stemphylium lycopersici]|uniref:Uncharacterized protein n=1 Tax=Stemphylium lycopersici TaxID=183478 RepID=A0A364N1C0_STELY|nr:hypothetical protein TW65_08813 [Stemphylium lycopersici]RAR08934.1 hypothetical protein DDE83_005771 [Stemphylium lycopersici]RAR12042.1 hypothetical protein DDE82_000382 [Stemphylium lycopersici]